MAHICPKCRSDRIKLKNYAKRTGSTIGTAAGVAAGAAGMLSGAEIGATSGSLAGPAGIFIGGIAGAILGALLGGSAGCTIGAKFGAVIDENILDNYHCLACGHTFSKTSEPSDSEKQAAAGTYAQQHPPDGFAYRPHSAGEEDFE